MKKLQVPIEVELLQEVKVFALKSGKTLKEVVSDALKAHINVPSSIISTITNTSITSNTPIIDSTTTISNTDTTNNTSNTSSTSSTSSTDTITNTKPKFMINYEMYKEIKAQAEAEGRDFDEVQEEYIAQKEKEEEDKIEEMIRQQEEKWEREAKPIEDKILEPDKLISARV